MNKEKLISILIGVVSGYILAMCVVISFRSFNETYKLSFRSPVIFQKPIVLEKRKWISPVKIDQKRQNTVKKAVVSPTPTPTTSKRVEILNSDIVDKIAILESGNGTAKTGLHTYCQRQGKVNIWGFAVSVKHCFNSLTAGRVRIGQWFEDQFNAGLTLKEAACKYNIGIRTENCSYAYKLLSML